ncbi:UDP-N-acetylglucosamine 2-epimerase [uncultured Clostridium sp.]|uniref:UDP-N-acetylglucosamine 2-epimerase n=1 Tax=uncultured Clostridium sp. TaxID=59620 RepID=UPI0028E686A5|nr:UDP-N-acetylglucosamine 2-epimerase [uncultured Clostridium sp.]
MKKKVLFLTGTRADYGKLKSLMKEVDQHEGFELYVFITGMHMLSKYGSTFSEIEKDGFKNIYKYINQASNSGMDIALSNTLLGLSNYVAELKPDLIVIHGDRLEALAGAIIGSFNNIKVAHIEGGEVSGTIDESIRHAITKFSHLHFVSNEDAKMRVMQLGEKEEDIYIIGSPDIDIMYSSDLPTLEKVKKRYDLFFENYSILMYHSVTTEIHRLNENVKELVDSILESKENYVVVYPNNDIGTEIILEEYERFKDNSKIKVYPSIRFEYFLTLLKNCKFIIGNSSAGIREAGVYGIPSVDIGNRQQGRYDVNNDHNIIHVKEEKTDILNGISMVKQTKVGANSIFGNGNSHKKFIRILEKKEIWERNFNKKFVDIM